MHVLTVQVLNQLSDSNFAKLTVSLLAPQKEWLDQIEECKKNFKLKLEQELNIKEDCEVASKETISSSSGGTISSSNSTNSFLDNNPFANDDGDEDDDDDDDDKNPFKEKKSTNPFDEDEGGFICKVYFSWC